MKYAISLLILIVLSFSGISQVLTVDQKVDSLLSLMTLDEKIGQMTQAERGALESVGDIAYYNLGSLLSGGGSAPAINTVQEWSKMYDEYQAEALKSRLGIPLIYGIDAVHGNNNVFGAVIFPHNIGLGCTWNPDLVKSINEITAVEVAATGIDWTFSPCIAVPQNEQWGRTYEGFGETPEIQKIMAAASVEGLQGNDLSLPETILACAKHFVGDGGTTNGTDQGNTEISEDLLRSIHMAGYIDAINANVGSVMASYNSWNGQKLHGYGYLLTDVLKDELGFEGFVISDWKGVDQIDEDYRQAVKRAINAGIDMVMVPDRYIYFISILKDLVENNEVSMVRIDDAVKRILKQKFLLNLFQEPFTDKSLIAAVGSAEHRDVARQAVRESMVLLAAKNNVLPLQKNNQTILVAGNLADDLGAQCGGWTISWQGSSGAITDGTTILEGMRNLSETSDIIYSASGDTYEPVDVAVVVVGEQPYAEGAGDRTSLSLSQDDRSLIKKLKNQGLPVIIILISGRPMIISEELTYSDALIAGWLPGTEGEGIAQILFGDYTPSGQLSHSWPKSMAQIPINWGDANYSPLFNYKFGLQDIPNSITNPSLKPYAARLNEEGDKILFFTTDRIASLNNSAGEFILKVDNEIMTDPVSDLVISELDSSLLEISLSQAIDYTTADISLSYLGTGIESTSASLQPFNDFYVYNGRIDYGIPKTIPGRVEAEDFVAMLGIGVESTSDTGSGQNVGWIDGGDWLEYYVDVTAAGDYTLTARIAGYESGTLQFTFNDSTHKWLSYAATGGWQNWENFSTTIELDSGAYIMRVDAGSGAFNINYFDFEAKILTAIETSDNLNNFAVYPNPVGSAFTLDISTGEMSNVSIALYDLKGILKKSYYRGNLKPGFHQFNFNLDSTLSSGVYFLEIKDQHKRYFEKIIKN